MKLESQIRRGLFGLVTFAALGLVAVAHGGQVPADGFAAADPAVAQCGVLQWTAPIVARGDAEPRADWRALLPAMIIRTRD
jgi:hypothetical protein